MSGQSSGHKQFAVCCQLLPSLKYRVRERDAKGGRVVAHGGAAGGLQVRFPMVSLELFIDIILPAAIPGC